MKNESDDDRYDRIAHALKTRSGPITYEEMEWFVDQADHFREAAGELGCIVATLVGREGGAVELSADEVNKALAGFDGINAETLADRMVVEVLRASEAN